MGRRHASDCRAARQAEGEKKPRQVRVDAFPRGTVLMNELMTRLMEAVRPVPVLREKLYQANFQTTLSGHAMVRQEHCLAFGLRCGSTQYEAQNFHFGAMTRSLIPRT